MLAVPKDLLRLEASLRHALVAASGVLEVVVVREQVVEALPGPLDVADEVGDDLVELLLVEGGLVAVAVGDLAGLAPDLLDLGLLADAEVVLDVLRHRTQALVDAEADLAELAPSVLGRLDLGGEVAHLLVEVAVPLGGHRHVFLFSILVRCVMHRMGNIYCYSILCQNSQIYSYWGRISVGRMV